MKSSSQFIDYFVHDILDYTLLKNEHGQFKRNMQVFDLKESIQTVEDILRDKAHMKNIKVKKIFENFEEGNSNSKNQNPFFVKTD
jgi:signal transduction histidine kinase